jgi:DNA-binding HxlR family transcriptional regulator
LTRTDLHALLGHRWSLPALEALTAAPLRFNELRRACPGVSARSLALTLDRLQWDGEPLVRQESDNWPVYALTDRARQVLAWSNLLPLVGA